MRSGRLRSRRDQNHRWRLWWSDRLDTSPGHRQTEPRRAKREPCDISGWGPGPIGGAGNRVTVHTGPPGGIVLHEHGVLGFQVGTVRWCADLAFRTGGGRRGHTVRWRADLAFRTGGGGGGHTVRWRADLAFRTGGGAAGHTVRWCADLAFRTGGGRRGPTVRWCADLACRTGGGRGWFLAFVEILRREIPVGE